MHHLQSITRSSLIAIAALLFAAATAHGAVAAGGGVSVSGGDLAFTVYDLDDSNATARLFDNSSNPGSLLIDGFDPGTDPLLRALAIGGSGSLAAPGSESASHEGNSSLVTSFVGPGGNMQVRRGDSLSSGDSLFRVTSTLLSPGMSVKIVLFYQHLPGTGVNLGNGGLSQASSASGRGDYGRRGNFGGTGGAGGAGGGGSSGGGSGGGGFGDDFVNIPIDPTDPTDPDPTDPGDGDDPIDFDFSFPVGSAGPTSYGSSFNFTEGTPESTALVPEPASLTLWGIGAAGFAVVASCRRRRAAIVA